MSPFPPFPSVRRWAPLVLGLSLLGSLHPAVAADDLAPVVESLAERYRLPGAVLLVSGPEGRQVVVTGDFNTAHQEIDLANPKENAKTSGFLPEERAWIDRYLAHGFVDAYRQLYPERVQYTWWTYRFGARGRNIGWRLDYYLVSPGLMERVQDVVVYDAVTGSDHCPVSLILQDKNG